MKFYQLGDVVVTLNHIITWEDDQNEAGDRDAGNNCYRNRRDCSHNLIIAAVDHYITICR